MAATIPEKFAAMLHKKVFVYLATIMPDGSPQVTPVWVDYDGRNILFNSAKGRVKDKNVRRDPRVTISVSDPENPYSYFEVRGRVIAMTEKGANEHIDKMAQKYIGQEKYPWAKPGEVRVIYTVEPEHVSSMG
jgi:PPOX class probable F420-dependent enzyme